MIERSALRYQPFYCEENVAHLAGEPIVRARPRSIVFVSNEGRTTAMWNQRAAGRLGRAMVWDYHVILLVEGPWEIWDLDTHLPFPTPAIDYLARTFRPDIPECYSPRFRVVGAETFEATFASDRAHMRRRDGRYTKPPPPWPPIGAPDREPNLMRFVDMEAPFIGEVMDLAALVAKIIG